MTHSKASKTLQTLGMIMKVPQFSAKNVPKVENSSGKKRPKKIPSSLCYYHFTEVFHFIFSAHLSSLDSHGFK